jgi:MoaA/NifB/PqqE/SkfB family radical SAM enzyme
MAPWVHACIQPQGQLVPCCNWTGKTNYSYIEFDQWINSEEMKSLRQSLHDGEKVSGCQLCWHSEEHGKRSLRQIYNAEFAKYFNFKTINDEFEIIAGTIKTFDFKLGNLCNLKCVMCNASSSSQILTEYKTHSEKYQRLEFYQAPEVNAKYDWPLSTEFGNFIDTIKGQIKWIKFTGGEPTIIPKVIDTIETLNDTKNITLSITTNGTTINKKFLSALDKFGTLWINVSLEGIKEHNNQIRTLSSWETIKNNILNLKKLPNCYFRVSHVFQALSLISFIPLLQWCEKHDISIELIPLQRPSYLTINSVPLASIEKFKNDLEKLEIIRNHDVVEKVLSLISQYRYDCTLQNNRIRYFKTLDSIRNTNLTKLNEEIN